MGVYTIPASLEIVKATLEMDGMVGRVTQQAAELRFLERRNWFRRRVHARFVLLFFAVRKGASQACP
jgi:hypothetical protein